MKYTIRKTETGWEIVNGDGTVLASFTGTEHGAYNDALAHLATIIGRGEAAAIEDGTGADSATGTGEDGLLPERWTDVSGIAFQELLPGGRDFTECEWSWRDPAVSLVPLMLLTTTSFGGHLDAELAGFVEAFSLDGGTVHANGRFYDNEAGVQFRDLLLDGRRFGVSVDPSEAVTVSFECTDMDEFGWCSAGVDKFEAYEIAGLTGVPFPGFEEAAVKLAASNRPVFMREGSAGLRLAMGDNDDSSGDDADDSPEADAEKETHDEVNYIDAGPDGSQCQNCMHFDGDDPDAPHCMIVQDPILAEGSCDRFEAPMMDGEEEGAASVMRAALSLPAAPPRSWFELPEPELGVEFLDGLGDDVLVEQRRPVYDSAGRVVGFGDEVLGLATPFTIRDDGLVYGHLTYWGQCHVGSPWGPSRCASASPSASNYEEFHASGYVVCDDGSELRTGLLHVGCEHSTAMDVRGVRDAAAHAGLAFAQVRVTDGVYGPWLSGCLLPTVTEEQVVKLRALTLSGEWVPELGAVIAVNDGGLPLQRADKIAASSGAVFPIANRVLRSSVKNGVVAKLVGGNPIYRCPECQKRKADMRAQQEVGGVVGQRLAAIEAQLDLLLTSVGAVESRTRHLIPAEAAAVKDRLTRS